MTRYRQWLIDDFEDHAAGEIVANQSGTSWAAEAADDDLASVVADTRFGATKALRIHDESRTTQADVTKTLPVALVVGDIFRIQGIHCVTGDYSKDVLYIKLREGATTCISLRIVLTTGVISYTTDGSSYTNTSQSVTLDAVTANLDVELTSASTFKVRVAGLEWSTAYDNDNAITTSITKVEIASAEDNDDGGVVTDTIDEPFDYNSGDSMSGKHGASITWGACTNTATEFFKALTTSGVACMHCYDSSGAASLTILATFDTSSPQKPDATHQYQFSMDVYVISGNPATQGVGFRINDNGGNRVTDFTFCGDGVMYVIDNSPAWVASGITFSLNAWHTIDFLFTDTQKMKFRIDAGAWTSETTVYQACNNPLGQLSWQMGAAVTGEMYVDDVTASWTSSTVYTAGDTDVYIGPLWGLTASSADGLQQTTLRLATTVASVSVDSRFPAFAVPSADPAAVLVYAPDQGKIYRVTTTTTALDTWTSSIEVADMGVFVSPTAGTIICAYTYASGVTSFMKSTDYGVNWSDWGTWGADVAGDDTDNRYVVDMFVTGGNVYAVALGANRLCIGQDPGADAAWTAKDTETIVFAFPADVRDSAFSRGFTVSVTYACGCEDNADAVHFSWASDTNTVTQRGTMHASYLPSNTAGFLYSDEVIKAVDGQIAHVIDTATGDVLSVTSGDGLTWTTKTPANARSGVYATPHAYARSGYYQYMVETSSSTFYRYNKTLMKLDRVGTLDVTVGTGEGLTVIDDGTVLYHVGSGVEIYTYETTATSAVTCDIYRNVVVGSSCANRCEFSVTSSDASCYSKGDTVMFYDAFDQLWFQGRITTKAVAQGLCRLEAEDTTRETARYYNATFSAKKASVMIDTIVDTFSHGYAGTFQDVNYAGTFDYALSSHGQIDAFIPIYRAIERAVLYATPAGQWNSKHHDDATATGYRIKNIDGLTWSLAGNQAHEVDARVTRTSFVYSDAGTATRVVVTGDASLEVEEGIMQAREMRDTSITASGDATDIATQLWNILSLDTVYLHMVVSGWGFLQEGQSVDVSWSLGDTVVARQTMLILAVHANALADVSEVLLSNNIVLEHELANLALQDDSDD